MALAFVHRRNSRAAAILFSAILFWGPLVAFPSQGKEHAAHKAKLPKSRLLGRGLHLERDPVTGELRAHDAGETVANSRGPGATAMIRSRVELVEIACTVTAPDGTQVRGLTRDDFRVFENGSEQSIASFDAATTPANIVLVLDVSPSIYREFGEMRDAARSLSRSLAPDDEVAVVAFANETHLLLPFSRDRNLLAAALGSPELARVANSSQSFVYRSVYLSAHELFRGRAGRKALVLLTDGQDSELGLTWNPSTMMPAPDVASSLAFEDVARELAADGIELYVISTENRPRAMTNAWLDEHRNGLLVSAEARNTGIAQYTLYLAEMVREVGGNLYFLHELGGLADVYHRIALALGAEYTLGYYPASGTGQPGWRSLRVELRSGVEGAPARSQVANRVAYYVPAAP